MRKRYWILWGLAFLALIIIGGFAWTNGEEALAQAGAEEKTKAHLGEDGVEYLLQVDTHTDWPLGKIEPVVEEESQALDELNVIVYVKGPDLNKIAREAKALHKPQIENIAEQIRGIHRKYRPDRSLAPDEEEDGLFEQQLAMSEEDKDAIKALRKKHDRNLDAMRKEVGLALKKAVAPNLDTVADYITTHEGSVNARIAAASGLGAQIPSNFLLVLAEHPLVLTIMKDRPTEYELNVSIPTCDYDTWWNDGLDGGAYDFGIVDSGVQEDHPAFSGVTFYSKSGSSVTGSHGTHVTGIVASSNTTYRGGAYGLDAIIWANSGTGSTTAQRQAGTMANMEWLASSAGQGPEVVNHSLGYGTANTDDYSPNDSFYDAYIGYYNIMVTKSCGNGGWDDDDPTITHPAPAYNLMAVANMDDQNTTTRTDDVRDSGSSGSSVGPTVYGRKKPDITAPGSDIMSTNSNWATGADFIAKWGTSMAAPHVAAAIVLMEDGANHIPMAQKAVLINTADAWDSNDTSTTTDDGSVTGSHWDKSYGWGYLDMLEAHYNRSDYFVDSVVPRNDNATPDDYKLYKGIMFTNEKATLVWEKRSNYVAGVPPTTTYNLADLNIRLYDEGDGSQVDSELGGGDNVHQVAADSSIDAVIKVYSWSTSFQGATSEQYALATEENFVQVDPPSFQRNYTRPNYVGPYQTFDVIVRIFNNGEVTAHSNTVTLQNITGVTVQNTNSHALPSILPGPYPDNPQQTTYTLSTSGLTAGTHWLPLDFESNCYLETYTYSTTQGVSIRVETTPPTSSCTAPTYANSSPIAISWTASDTQTGVNRTYLYVKRPGDATFLYSGVSATGTSGTFNYSPAAGNGLYQFAVRSLDKGGNWEALPTAAEDSTFYDTVTPSSSVSTPTIDTGGSIPLSFTVTDPSPSSGLEFVDFWYKKGAGGTWTYTGVHSTSMSGTVYFTPTTGDGTYFFASRAKDRAQNLESYPSGGDDSTVYDTTPPTGSILINGGAATTSSLIVTLNLKATDTASGVKYMRFSNNGSSWAAWEAYAATRSGWSLSAYGGNNLPGKKTTYVQFRDAAGHVSSTYSDSIMYSLALPCEGDFDGDGDVDGSDLSIFAADYGRTNCDVRPPCEGDFDGDGDVDGSDLSVFAADYGRTDCP
jgi:serine protease AprX